MKGAKGRPRYAKGVPKEDFMLDESKEPETRKAAFERFGTNHRPPKGDRSEG